MKKGQMSLFLILGIVIAVVIIVGIYFRGEIFKSALEKETAAESVLPSEVQELKDVVTACIDDIAKNNLILLGMQAGYLELPADVLVTEEGLVVPFYFDEGENKAPTEEQVLTMYANAIDSEVPDCIQGNTFPKLDIVPNPPSTQITLDDNLVKTSTDYKLRVTSNGISYNLKQPYEYSYQVNLKKILDTSRQITAKIVEDPSILDFEYLLEFDYDIDIMPIEDNTEIYLITDNSSIIDEEVYQFIFANRRRMLVETA